MSIESVDPLSHMIYNICTSLETHFVFNWLDRNTFFFSYWFCFPGECNIPPYLYTPSSKQYWQYNDPSGGSAMWMAKYDSNGYNVGLMSSKNQLQVLVLSEYYVFCLLTKRYHISQPLLPSTNDPFFSKILDLR